MAVSLTGAPVKYTTRTGGSNQEELGAGIKKDRII